MCGEYAKIPKEIWAIAGKSFRQFENWGENDIPR